MLESNNYSPVTLQKKTYSVCLTTYVSSRILECKSVRSFKTSSFGVKLVPLKEGSQCQFIKPTDGSRTIGLLCCLEPVLRGSAQEGSTTLCTPAPLDGSRPGQTHLAACRLALDASHLAHQGQVEARAEAALQEERGACAVEPPLREDGDAVPQQVGLVHVVSGHDDGSACEGRGRGITGQARARLDRECVQSPPHYTGSILGGNK